MALTGPPSAPVADSAAAATGFTFKAPVAFALFPEKTRCARLAAGQSSPADPVLMSVVRKVALVRWPGSNDPRKMSARELGNMTRCVAHTGSDRRCDGFGPGH